MSAQPGDSDWKIPSLNIQDLEPHDVSLYDRTVHFLRARQRGRATAQDHQHLCDEWQLIKPSVPLPGELDGHEAHMVNLKGKRLKEMRLIQIPADEHKNQPAMCVYGCGKWFNNQVYVISDGLLLTLE